jgi:CheY-like chemotaxis protein/tetratricopeptide (TPR) repeat protein
MKIASQPATSTANRTLTLTERAQVSCDQAKQLEKAGDYEAACEALGEFWQEHHGQPKLEGLDQATAAEVLLRVGVLTGWLGSVHQSESSQETAKNLITRSIEIFEAHEQSEKAAEAHADLALCYWREGAFDEARIRLANALGSLKDKSNELKAIVLIRAGLVEVDAQRLDGALGFYGQAAPLVERSEDHALKAAFHHEYALLLRRLGITGDRNDYIDRALIEYAAASFHFEQAGNTRGLARVENNLGYLFFTVNRFHKAFAHLDRARRLFLESHDVGSVAQVDDTRARALLAQGRFIEAERVVRSSVKTLEKGGQQSVLAEALTTHGIALARLGRDRRSRTTLQRAKEIAETSGDLEGAGRAQLSIIEELGDRVPVRELAAIYQSAADLLKLSQDPSTTERLASCARKVIDAFETLTASLNSGDPGEIESDWEGFSFKERILECERALIERALKDSGGSVTKAARLLGFKHHQSLISILNGRHKGLLKVRSTIRARRRRILFSPDKSRKKQSRSSTEEKTSTIRVLFAEDNKLVANLVRDMLVAEEWLMEICQDGEAAWQKLASNERYDLLLFDNNLPGRTGLELTRRARSLANRRRTPIIMVSATDCETEAWRAGVDAFLRKPDDIDKVPSTIARLLEVELKHSY